MRARAFSGGVLVGLLAALAWLVWPRFPPTPRQPRQGYTVLLVLADGRTVVEEFSYADITDPEFRPDLQILAHFGSSLDHVITVL